MKLVKLGFLVGLYVVAVDSVVGMPVMIDTDGKMPAFKIEICGPETDPGTGDIFIGLSEYTALSSDVGPVPPGGRWKRKDGTTRFGKNGRSFHDVIRRAEPSVVADLFYSNVCDEMDCYVKDRESGMYPIHFAAVRGDKRILAVLLGHMDGGIDILDDSRRTALAIAAGGAVDENIVRSLLEHGANPDLVLHEEKRRRVEGIREEMVSEWHCIREKLAARKNAEAGEGSSGA